MHARREPNPQRSVAGNRCRKVHPADAANAALFARAVRFDIALFLGTGGYARAGAPTLEKARVEARRLAAENASPFGKRQPLIYGITVDGASAFAEAVRSEPDSIE